MTSEETTAAPRRGLAARECLQFFLLYFMTSVLYHSRSMLEGRVILDGDAYTYFAERACISQMLHQTFSWWLPYQLLGTSWVGMDHTTIIYPLSYAYYPLPLPVANNLYVIVHYSLAAFFTWLYLRQCGIERSSAFIGGLVYGFSSFITAHRSHITIVAAMAWAPLAIYFYERIRQKANLTDAVWAGVVLGLQVFAGHFQISVYTYLLLAFYSAFWLARMEKPRRFRFALGAVIPVIISVAVGLPQIVATHSLASHSWLGRPDYAFFSGYSYSFCMLPNLLFPWFFGGKGFGPYWGEWNLNEMSGSFGALALVLAVWVAMTSRRDGTVRFWAYVMALSFMVALGGTTPLYRLLFTIPVISSFEAPARNFMEFTLAGAVLCAYGLHFLRQEPVCEQVSRRLAGVMWAIVFFTVVAVFMAKQFLKSPLCRQFLSESGAHLVSVNFSRHNAALSVPLLLICLYALWLHAARWGLCRRWPLAICVLALLVFAESYSFGGFVDDTWPTYAELNHLTAGPVVQFIKRHSRGERALDLTRANPRTPLYMMNRISLVNGFDPFIPRAYRALLGGLPDVHSGAVRNWPLLLANNSILSLLNTRWIILRESMPGLDVSPLYQQCAGAVRGGAGLATTVPGALGPADSWTGHAAVKPGTIGVLSLISSAKAASATRFVVYAGPLGSVSDRVSVTFDGAEVRQESVIFWHAREGPNDVTIAIRSPEHLPLLLEKVELEPNSSGRPAGIPYRKVLQSPEGAVYENTRYLPRMFLVAELRQADDFDSVREALYLNEINPSKVALVAGEDLRHIGSRRFSPGRVELQEVDGSDRARAKVTCSGPAFLVVGNRFYPGWEAVVDGRQSDVYRVDGTLMGIRLPPGEHSVELKYRPATLLHALWFSGCVLSICLIGLVLAWIRERRVCRGAAPLRADVPS